MSKACPLKTGKHFQAAVKLYNNNLEDIYKDWLESDGNWSEKVKELAGEEIVDEAGISKPSNTVINLSIENRKTILNNLNIKVQQFNYLSKKDPDNKNLKVKAKQLSTFYNDVQTLEDELLVLSYLEHSFNSLENVNAKINDFREQGKLTIGGAMRIIEEIKNLDSLKNINFNFNTATEEGRQSKKYLESLLGLSNEVSTKVLDFVRDIFTEELANNKLNKIYTKHRANAEKEYNKIFKEAHSGKPREERRQLKEDYIAKYFSDNAEKIHLESLMYYNSYVKNIMTDLGSAESWFNNTFIDESIFKILNNGILVDFDIAKTRVEQDMMSLEELFNNYAETVGSSSSTLEFWQPFLTGKGEATQLLDPKGKNNYLVKKSRKEKGLNVSFSEEDLKWESLLANTAAERLYNKLLDLSKKADKNYTTSGKLNLKLPFLEKEQYKKITEGGVGGVFSSLKEMFKITDKVTDIIGSEVTAFTSINDKVINGVPIYMRSKIEDKDRNFDVVTLLLMNYYNSEIFSARMEHKDMVEAAQFMVANANIKDSMYHSFRKKVTNQDGNTPWQQDPTQSNLYKRLEDLKESMIYGKGLKANKNTAAAIQLVNRASSLINLSLNSISAVASYGNNLFQNLESRISDTQFISRKSANIASKKYAKYANQQLKDWGRGKSKSSFFGQLYTFYNPGLEGFNIDFKSENKSLFARHANMGTLMALQKASDTPAYSIVMLSFLEETKVTNEKNEFLNSEGKVVENKSEAMSLMEAYEQHFEETGEIGFPKFVKGNSYNGDNSLKGLKKLARTIQNFSSERFGAYGSMNKSSIQRHPLGSLFYSQRGFLIPILLQKWKGAGGIIFTKDKLSDLDVDRRSIDETSGKFTEGTYATMVAIMKDIIFETKATKDFLKARKSILNDLNDRDLAQFRRGQVEVIILSALLAMSIMLFNAGDDDDDEALLASAFLVRRLYSELRSPSSFNELLRYFKQPVVATGVLDKFTDISAQFIKDLWNLELEKYEKGDFKGESKLIRKLYKTIPGYNQINRNYDWKRMYKYLENM